MSEAQVAEQKTEANTFPIRWSDIKYHGLSITEVVLQKKYYKQIGIDEIDKQMSNFYNSINAPGYSFNKQELMAIKDQGEGLRRLLKDYFEVRVIYVPDTNIVSQDTVFPSNYVPLYYKYVLKKGWMLIPDLIPSLIRKFF